MAEYRQQRELERVLQRIFRSYGVSTTNIEGVDHIGICSSRQLGNNGGAYVPSSPAVSVAVALPTLARDILEALR
jgi:hypothetical protein